MSEGGEHFSHKVEQRDSKRLSAEEEDRLSNVSLEVLQNMGVFVLDEKDQLVVDLEKLSNFSIRKFKSNFPSLEEGGLSGSKVKRFAGSRRKLFLDILNNPEIVAKGHEEEGSKKLIFIPESTEDLSDIDKMRNSWVSLTDVGKTHQWNRDYPTIDNRSDLSQIEVHVPYMIYKHGNGERDNNGILQVDREIGRPESGRQPISGQWFVRNGMKGPSNTRWDENPRGVIETFGAVWQQQDLIKPSDIPQANWDKKERNITNDSNGRVTIDGKVFSLGSEYAGGKAEPLTPTQYVVRPRDGSAIAVLDVQMTKVKMAETNVVSVGNGKKQLSVPKTATDIRRLAELGSYSNFSYEGNRRNREIVIISRELPSLLLLREAVNKDTKDAMSNLSLRDQINVSMYVRDTEEDGRGLEFIEKTGENGMRLLADTRSRGGTDRRLIEELLEKEDEERVFLLEQYHELRTSTERLMNTLHSQAEEKGADDNTLILTSRIGDAVKARCADFLHAATREDDQNVVENMQTLSEGADKLASLLEGRLEHTFNHMPDPKQGSTSGRYNLADGSVLSITVRPRAVDSGQARVSFKYKSPKGKSADLRIDHDKYGISLDISRRGANLINELDNLGKTYHTQGAFERGLSINPVEFEEFSSKIPFILGWPQE